MLEQTTLTTEELAKISTWIRSMTYSGSSHTAYDQGNPEWLREDELQQYLPKLIGEILKGRNV